MSALDMTPEQVATFVSRTKEDFAHYSPEVTPNCLCSELRGQGYTATMGNLQAVYTALVEAAKPKPLGRLPELIMSDSDCYRLRGYFDVKDQQARVECVDDVDNFITVDLTPAQLRQLATWSLGAADHLDGVEPPGRELHMDQHPHGLMVRAGHLCPAHLRVGSRGFNLHASCDMRQVARKLLELADAHDAGGAA